jgi:hypothetical protein
MLFKDIHKRTDDLLNKDWVHGNAVEVENNWKSSDFTFKNKASVSGGIAIADILPNLTAAASCPAMTSCCGGGCAPAAAPTGTLAPVFTSELTYDQPNAAFIFKFDSAGATTKELNLKNLFSQTGLTLNNKFTFKNAACSGYEATVEYLTAQGVHAQVNLNPCKTELAANATYAINKAATVGAEVSGPSMLLAKEGKQNVKLGVSGVYALPSSVNYGEARLGVKASHTLGETKSHVHAYLAVKQNKTESVFHLTQALRAGAAPSLVFVAKHELNKEASVKAAITDALAVKAAVNYRASALLSASIGLGFEQKTGAKAGLKIAFNQ